MSRSNRFFKGNFLKQYTFVEHLIIIFFANFALIKISLGLDLNFWHADTINDGVDLLRYCVSENQTTLITTRATQ